MESICADFEFRVCLFVCLFVCVFVCLCVCLYHHHAKTAERIKAISGIYMFGFPESDIGWLASGTEE